MAIKELKDKEDQQYLKMFLDEIHLHIQLIHQNIVRLYDIIPDASCMVMEYAHGADLKEIINRLKEKGEKVPSYLAAYIIYQVAKGLSYAHSKKDSTTGRALNVIHRDISPENILISFAGGVKLADFGIAKATLREEKTRTGVLKGKISYMSPEQAEGAEIDQQSDIYSLGIVFYELLTETKLYEAKSEYKLITKVISGKVDWRPVDQLDIDEPLKDLLKKMLQKDKKQRAQSVKDDVIVPLERYLLNKGKIHQEDEISAMMEILFPDKKNMPSLEEMPEEVESRLDTMREEAAQKAEQQGEKTIFDIIRMRSTKYEKVIKRGFAGLLILLFLFFVADVFYFHFFRISRLLYGKIAHISLYVKTVPSSAKITVTNSEGKQIRLSPDTSPCAVYGLKDGVYTIKASLDGYISEPKQIEIREGKVVTGDTCNLIFQIPLEVATFPSGGELYINDNYIGSTPYSGKIPYDSIIDIKLEYNKDYANFEPLTITISPDNDSAGTPYIYWKKHIDSPVKYFITGIFKAHHTIRVYPPNAVVTIESEAENHGFKNENFKQHFIDRVWTVILPTGKNTIKISKKGYLPSFYREDIVDSSRTETLVVLKKYIRFEARDKKTGRPIHAKGQIRRLKPHFPGIKKIFTIKSGRRIALPAGRYKVTFTNPCYQPKSREFSTEDTSRRVIIRLMPSKFPVRITLNGIDYNNKYRIEIFKVSNLNNPIEKVYYRGKSVEKSLGQGDYMLQIYREDSLIYSVSKRVGCGTSNDWEIYIPGE